MKQHLWLYVLELEQGKWYVGITPDVEKRFEQHKKGTAGTAWTKAYAPTRVEARKDLGEIELEKARQLEGRIMLKYMEKYGENNVRGGDMGDTSANHAAHPTNGGKDKSKRGFFRNNWELLLIIVLLIGVIVFLLLDKFVFSASSQAIIYQ
jgi:predicted GIY-YIG superfamily endonuclease